MLFSADGQFEGGFAGCSTPDRRLGEQPPTEGIELTLLQLTQSRLQEDAQVVVGDGQMVKGFGAPERLEPRAEPAPRPA